MARRFFLLAFLLTMAVIPSSAQYNMRKLMEEGRRTLEQGFYVQSMTIFQRVVSLKPNVYEAWYLSGLSKYHLDDFTGAVEDCTQAINLNPYIADIYDLRAMSRMAIEQYDSAAVDYTSALEIDAQNRDYWFNRAYCFYMCDNPSTARQQLDYITKRWGTFDEARELYRALNNGRKPNRKNIYRPSSNLFRVNDLSKGNWILQRFPEEKDDLKDNPPNWHLK